MKTRLDQPELRRLYRRAVKLRAAAFRAAWEFADLLVGDVEGQQGNLSEEFFEDWIEDDASRLLCGDDDYLNRNDEVNTVLSEMATEHQNLMEANPEPIPDLSVLDKPLDERLVEELTLDELAQRINDCEKRMRAQEYIDHCIDNN